MKYYFEYPEAEMCYTKDHFYDLMEDDELLEMKVYPAKMIKGQGVFYCHEYAEVGESHEGCGKMCEFYKPRNGKNGRCRHHSNTYEPMDEPIILKR